MSGFQPVSSALFCNKSGFANSCNKNKIAMISEQIISDYTEQENDYSEKMMRAKIALLFISVAALIFFSF